MASKQHHRRALQLCQTGHYGDAIAPMKAAVQEAETSELWSDLGFVYMATGDSVAAERALQHALQLDPDNHDAAANLGKLLTTLQRWPAALAIFEKLQPALQGDAQAAVLNLIQLCRSQMPGNGRTTDFGAEGIAYDRAFAMYPDHSPHPSSFEDVYWLFTGTFVGGSFVPEEGKNGRGAIRLNYAEGKALYEAVAASTGNILEIGRFFAGSTILISVAAKDRLLVSVDKAPRHHPTCTAYFERCLNMPILLTQDSGIPIGGRFGCLFIDGDHTFEGALRDTKTHWPQVDVGGLVIYHDAVRGAFGAREGVTRITEALALGCGELIATADSLAVFRKLKELPTDFMEDDAPVAGMTPAVAPATVVCVKWGDKYPPDYVNRLYRMVARNLTIPHRFVCLTDNSSGLRKEIEIVDIAGSQLGYYWAKLLILGRRPELTGRVLYLDLDVVITGNIDSLLSDAWDAFTGVANWNSPGINSSVMRFEAGRFAYLLEEFQKRLKDGCHWFETMDVTGHGDAPVLRFPGGHMVSDQEWVSSMLTVYGRLACGLFDPQVVVSYKRKGGVVGAELDTLPNRARIVVFHGRPKPHERQHPWILEHWN